MTCGIYKIINTANGKYYLGSSVNIKNRWKRHKWELRHDKHHNPHLQRAWNKYKEESFKFIIIEEVAIETILIKEQEYLDNLKPWDYTIGYNTSRSASGGDLITHHPNREAIIEKIKLGSKKWLDSLSDEERHEKFAKYGKDNPNFGVSWTKEQRDHLSKINIGKKRQSSSIEKQKISFHEKYDNNLNYKKMCSERSSGENNPFYGKTHNAETIEKMSKNAKERGNKNNVQKISVEIDGITYSSFSEAATAIGCSLATIRNRLNNPLKFPNYKLIPKLEQPALVEDCNLPV